MMKSCASKPQSEVRNKLQVSEHTDLGKRPQFTCDSQRHLKPIDQMLTRGIESASVGWTDQQSKE